MGHVMLTRDPPTSDESVRRNKNNRLKWIPTAYFMKLVNIMLIVMFPETIKALSIVLEGYKE